MRFAPPSQVPNRLLIQQLPMPSLLAQIPAELPNELTETLAQATNLRIERIVSHGHSSPKDFWYDQQENEWVLLVRGAARLEFADELVAMSAGDWINIPAHRKHRVAWTTPDEPSIWLAVFYE